MELRLTIMTPDRVGALTDVVVSAPPGTPLEAALPGLRSALGITADSDEIRCRGRSLDLTHPLGTTPLLQGAVLVLGGPDRPEPAMLEAQAVAGPDAGSCWPLRAGVNPVGRSSPSLIRPDDEDVSREHAELIVEPGRLVVRDRGSTNGTWVAGRRIEGDTSVDPDLEVTVGATTLLIGRDPRPPAATVGDGDGHLRVNRRPDLHPGRRSVELAFPPRPDDRAGPRIPWPAMLLPLLLAVPMAFFWHQPAFLAFALMSPLLMAGQFLYDRRSGRQEAADRLRRWQEVTAETEQRLAAAVAEDAGRLRELRPDLAAVAQTAVTPADDLWRRTAGGAEFLALRLGRGPEPSLVRVRRPGTGHAGEDSGTEVVTHPDAPVVVDLPAVTVLGICGPRPAVLGLARSLLGQAVVLHAPSDLRVTVLVAEPVHRAAWQWAGRLPHHAEPEAGVESARRVVVLDGASHLRTDPVVSGMLTAGRVPAAATSAPLVICLAASEQELPVECGATVVLSGRSAVLRRPGFEPLRFAPDLAGERWAERVSRGLAPLREATAGGPGRLPGSVRLTELVADTDEFDPVRSDALARHWSRAGRRGPTALIGVDAAGAVRIDLRRDGPHVLLGGTTGAGKSELLQTLIAGLAVDSGPDEMSFLLVDYKGGAAFRDCLGMPHVTGLITDLDPRLAARALASLRAELHRRERLLGGSGAVDLDEYRSAGGEGLARLVIVVDEFRVLAEELPDFVGGLMRVATVGRSLGVHLVLATQRPAGVVSPEISANTNLRIALRLRDEGDSRDLVGDPAAAFMSADVPGRALLRSGVGALRPMQAARVRGVRGPDDDPAGAGGPGRTAGHTVVVRPAAPYAFSARSEPEPSLHSGPAGETDLHALVRGLRGAAEALGLDPPEPPWLPPLPDRVGYDELVSGQGRGRDPRRRAQPGSGTQALIGVKDVPEQQRRAPLTWALNGRHLAVAGGPRSGRTTTARTLAQAAVTAGAHVYVVDGSGALRDLEILPGVAAVVPVSDLERCERLLARLRRFVAGAASSGSERVVLVVDGWEALVAAWNALDHGRLVDDLTALMRDGPAAGLQAALTGGRSLLTGAVSSLLTERLVLRFADPADALLAGIRSDLVNRTSPPGRAVHLGPDDADGHEVQVALPPDLVGLTRGGSAPAVGRDAGWAVPALPVSLSLDDVWSRAAGGPSDRPGEVPLGIGGDAASLVTMALSPLTVVLGPAGSGRTTALRCIAESLARLGRSTILISLDGADGHAADVPARVAAALGAGATVLVDDVRAPSALGDSPADRVGDLLADHLDRPAAAAAPGSGVVLACSPAEVISGFRGLPVVIRGARQGLVLGNAGPAAAEVLGVRPVVHPGAPPGRATLVRGGRATVVQLPTCVSRGHEAPGRAGYERTLDGSGG